MKHLDLFSGYGGFTIPAQKYGIETIGFSEIDKYACSVLNYHYPNIKNYGNITKIKGEDLPTVDIITGGSPCQDLSVAGKGAGLNGERSGLFFHFIRLIKEKQPTYFVWENVKGALSSQGGWDFARVQIEMEQAGYDVYWQVINAKDFGVPQNRERIFAIGVRKGSGREILFEQRESRQNPKQIIEGSQGSRVYDDTMAVSQKALGGGQGAKTGLYAVGMIDVIAKKRVHDTPVEINKFLRLHRKKPIGSIADKLALPKTQVEHYFRTDSSRAIPSPEIWIKLKELLGFDDTYDKQVTEFYEKEVEFESTRRVYDSKGVAKTTDTSGTGLYCVGIIPESFKEKGNARAVSTVGSQHPMYAIPSSNGNIHSLDANYWKGSNNPNKSRRSQIMIPTQIGNSKKFGNSTGSKEAYTLRASEPNGVIVHNLQPRNPNRPSLLKNKNAGGSGHLQRQDGVTYTVDTGCTQGIEIIGSTQKHSAKMENISPSLTKAMGDGGGHIPMKIENMRIRRLTPTECERLMGLEDNWTAKGIVDGKEVDISDTQRYKMCGNGVVVNCVDYIYNLITKTL